MAQGSGKPTIGALDSLGMTWVTDGVPPIGRQFRAHLQTIVDEAVGLGDEQATVTSHARHQDFAVDRAGFVGQHGGHGAAGTPG